MERFPDLEVRSLGSIHHPAIYQHVTLTKIPGGPLFPYLEMKVRQDRWLSVPAFGNSSRAVQERESQLECSQTHSVGLHELFPWASQRPANSTKVRGRNAGSRQWLASRENTAIEKRRQKIQEDVRHQHQETAGDRCELHGSHYTSIIYIDRNEFPKGFSIIQH
ncbi:putative uncharacterized protein encoded by LINC01559 [Loxodonta africana]|uniref:putative uncharacterized protein encoded by LINC01559 n=1 Tax=Loxodonta africana TaxID=9785 RepID=UPI0030D22705